MKGESKLEENLFEEDNIFIKKQSLTEKCQNDFRYPIRQRGRTYYEDDDIIDCYKDKKNNQYYARVIGSRENPYEVRIEISDDVYYQCDCPCDEPCKHEWAVLLAIDNFEYEEVNLKEEIEEKEIDIKEVIEQIPAEELKEYILNGEEEDVWFEMIPFENNFIKYCPKQGYDFYYNRLYNSLTLNRNTVSLLTSYIHKIERYLECREYRESFLILQSIIEAFHDTANLKKDVLISLFPQFSMFLRIMLRKGKIEIKEEVTSWIMVLRKENYYDNIYLEDMILEGIK